MAASDDDGQEGAAPQRDLPHVIGAARMRKNVAAALFGSPPTERSGQASGEGDSSTPGGGGTSGNADTVVASGEGRDPDADEEIPDQLGRFEIRERLGGGGMGEVFRAHDPQLSRMVAIKVLRRDIYGGDGKEGASARLLREAQAMAQLKDEHVIVVHDVGTIGDRVFIAMEYVEGMTLGQWTRKRPPWREVVAMFVRAGSGLAAAHKAGLVHRDFKPDNVLVGDAGEVRVMDFGLAHGIASEPESSGAAMSRAIRFEDTFGKKLTQDGAVMGTPVYMSPEQHLGRKTDARSDQFSFCVALWEALFGERPYVADSLAMLTAAVTSGRVTPPPGDVRVPRWIEAALRRGLSVRPKERFGSMEELLAELRRDPSRKWKVGVGAVAGLSAAVAAGVAISERYRAARCEGLVQSMDDVWGQGTRQSIASAIAASEVPWADTTTATTLARLDDYAAAWRKRSAEACRGAQASGAEDGWPRRRRCYEDRREELSRLAARLGEGGPLVSTRAVQSAVMLANLDVCQDLEHLNAWLGPAEPAARERLTDAWARLDVADASGAVGGIKARKEAIREATQVLADARQLEVVALEAAALRVRGTYRARTGDSVRAEEDLEVAVRRANESGDRATRAAALISLVYQVGSDSNRYDEAKEFGGTARAVVDSLDRDPWLEATLDAAFASVALRNKDYAEAVQRAGLAMEGFGLQVGPEHPAALRARVNLGMAQSSLGDYAPAEANLEGAVDGLRASPGGPNTELGNALVGLANNYARQSKFEPALAAQEEALTIYQKELGPNAEYMLMLEYNIAKLNVDLGDDREAIERLRRGLPRARATLGPDHESLYQWHWQLGSCLERQDSMAEAQDQFMRALDIRGGAGATVDEMAEVRFGLARLKALQDPAAGRVLAEQLDQELKAAERGGRELAAGTQTVHDELRVWLAEQSAAAKPDPSQ